MAVNPDIVPPQLPSVIVKDLRGLLMTYPVLVRQVMEAFRNYARAINALLALSDRLLTGTGSPEGAITAPVATLYLRTDGGTSTTLYVKESGTGNTGWVAK